MNKTISASEIRGWLLGLLILLLIPASAFAQNQRTVTGTVSDETGEPLIGATVKVVGQPIGAATDFDGRYTLKIPADAKQLTVSYVGYNNLIVNITSNVKNITMKPNSKIWDEIEIGRASCRERV